MRICQDTLKKVLMMLGSGHIGTWLGRKAEREIISACAKHLEKIFGITNQFKLFLDAYCDGDLDKALFAKVVDFYHKRDIARAKIYANELTEVRKLLKIIMTTRLALEQISVRLTTVREYGDVAANLAPAIRAVNEISGGISNIVPEADMSMSQLGEILQGVMVDAAQGDPLTTPQFGSEDGSDILKQAAMIAEERIARTLPDVPKLDRHREMLEI